VAMLAALYKIDKVEDYSLCVTAAAIFYLIVEAVTFCDELKREFGEKETFHTRLMKALVSIFGVGAAVTIIFSMIYAERIGFLEDESFVYLFITAVLLFLKMLGRINIWQIERK